MGQSTASSRIGILARYARRIFRCTGFSVLGALLLQTASLQVLAQQKSTGHMSGDAQAISVIESALGALGASWSHVHSVHLTGTMSVPGKEEQSAIPIEWKDVWKGGKVWHRHTMGDGSHARSLIQSPGQGQNLQLEDGSSVRAGEGTRLPPMEVPGAFLSVILEDQNCSAAGGSVSKEQQADEAPLVHVRISCQSPGALGGTGFQDWAFSSSSHLPVSVAVMRQNMRRAGTPFTETVYFRHYRAVDGLLVPDKCELKRGRLTRTVILQTIEFPDPKQFQKSDFEVSK
jgi:hypothetical protein